MIELRKENMSSDKMNWIKRVGFIGFLFFLVKGLVWLALAWSVWMGFSK
jgi:hypothetical protein